MKSLVWLSLEVLQDCGTRCGVNPSRDLITIMRRTEHEGDSFLTITLPDFCKGFERSLDIGHCLPSLFPNFRFGNQGYPRFLSGFLGRVFGPDGHLLDNPDVDCIFCVRQICLALKKIKLPCTKERDLAAQQQYVESDRKCGYPSSSEEFLCSSGRSLRITQLRESFRKVGSRIVCDVLRGEAFGLPTNDARARHGPGTNTNGLLGNSKWNFPYWPERVERFFPRHSFAWGSYSDALDRECDDWRLESLGGSTQGSEAICVRNNRSPQDSFCATYPRLVTPEQEPPVKVIFVPKTLKTPRVIAQESSVMQYAQQGVLNWLVRAIERSRLTGGRINFSDQQINQKAARLGSSDGSLATIDMKEASDLVSIEHVRDLFHAAPDTLELLESVRTLRATLPNRETILLRKFASMGSAVCFPVEALAFFSAIVTARIIYAEVPISAMSIEKYSKDVYVYGDDLIVPADEAPAVCCFLELIGFKVNGNKSFWTGKFRESCGKDWYDGYDVTPTYIRLPFPTNRRDASGVVSWVASSNQFYLAGLWRVANSLRARIERIVGKLPLVSRNSSSVGWHTFSNCVTIQRWNKHLHRFEFKGVNADPVFVEDILDGYPALLKCWSLIGSSVYDPSKTIDMSAVDPRHLTRSVKRSVFALKRTWAPSV